MIHCNGASYMESYTDEEHEEYWGDEDGPEIWCIEEDFDEDIE